VVDKRLNPRPYFSEEYKDTITSYVSALYEQQEDYLEWLSWQYSRLRHPKLTRATDDYLISNHGFRLEDLENASEYLWSIYKSCEEREQPPTVIKNELHGFSLRIYVTSGRITCLKL